MALSTVYILNLFTTCCEYKWKFIVIFFVNFRELQFNLNFLFFNFFFFDRKKNLKMYKEIQKLGKLDCKKKENK